MASGLDLCRIQRPDTWQLRPVMCKKVDKTLAKPEPSTHGAKRLKCLLDKIRPGSYGWPM